MIPIIERPILIAGAPRSGTSMVAGVVAKAGAWCGSCFTQEEFQPRGYFENIPITCCTWQVARARYHWNHKMTGGLPALNKKIAADLQARWGALIPTAMWSDGYGRGVWMYKLPQLVFFWPVWNSLYPNAQWVSVHRSKEKITESMARNWGDEPRMWRRLARLYLEALAKLEKALSPVIVQADEVAAGNVQFLNELDGVEFLTEREMGDHIVQDRWHNEEG